MVSLKLAGVSEKTRCGFKFQEVAMVGVVRKRWLKGKQNDAFSHVSVYSDFDI